MLMKTHKLHSFFFLSETNAPEIYTLSLHDALPICFLAVEPERAERRLVVELEESGRRRRRRVPVLDEVPRRRHERVTGLPREPRVTDARLAAPLEHVIDGARRAARGGRRLARAEPLALAAHRRQWRRPGP